MTLHFLSLVVQAVLNSLLFELCPPPPSQVSKGLYASQAIFRFCIFRLSITPLRFSDVSFSDVLLFLWTLE
jgi:hypothetical protein